ncbi:MAG: HAD family hydrolase [Bryobacterales bacterium]|nr:HAD family hydrolase [Bryobacterales bacterium]
MLETIRSGANAARARVVLFDFDGTLSTIRSGWVEVMVPMMVEILAGLKTGESEAELTETVREYVGRLTGKDTIYQMIELADQVSRRGGKAEDPLVYKHRYLDLLWVRIRGRVESLRKGEAAPDQYMVPGARALLDSLKERGLKMYLASGTDDSAMKEEARLLEIDRYFDGGCHGALDDYKSFSKAILIRRIIDAAEARGEEFLGFGDGFVEIENVKQVGGLAVGVATAEPECLRVDEWKRGRLVKVGADYIIPNYLRLAELNATLFPN